MGAPFTILKSCQAIVLLSQLFIMQHKALWYYITRITPAISLLWLLILIMFSFHVHPFGRSGTGKHTGKATIWQLLLSLYTVVLHSISLFFTVRACSALIEITNKISDAATIDEKGTVSTLLFAIIVPSYKETLDTLNDTMRVLAAHPKARSSYHVNCPSTISGNDTYDFQSTVPSHI